MHRCLLLDAQTEFVWKIVGLYANVRTNTTVPFMGNLGGVPVLAPGLIAYAFQGTTR